MLGPKEKEKMIAQLVFTVIEGGPDYGLEMCQALKTQGITLVKIGNQGKNSCGSSYSWLIIFLLDSSRREV